uniref:RRM domain-containing protein n=1 Tax=Timema poppense TaxID=170557 RepID=A0A7R9DS91_TIMPO|nr:unnamed protein product [Timema poppensis]
MDTIKSENDTDPPTIRQIRKVFVGNLPSWSKRSDLKVLFREFGKIADVHVVKRRRSKNCYGFVTFKYPESASKVLGDDRKMELGLKLLQVSPAYPEHQPDEFKNGKILNRDFGLLKGKSESTLLKVLRCKPNGGSRCEIARGRSLQTDTSISTDDCIDENKCFIDKLNDDCMYHLFSLLPKLELIKVERVCKRWQLLCLRTWLRQKDLTFYPLLSGSSKNPYYSFRALLGFLQRCGRRVTEVDISDYRSGLTSHALNVIAEHCKCLRHLNVSGLALSRLSLLSVGTVSEELRSIQMEECFGVGDKCLGKFFRCLGKLERVNLSRFVGLKGKCLKYLPEETTKEIYINDCNDLCASKVADGLRRLKNLETLQMNRCMRMTDFDIWSILLSVLQLRELKIEGCYLLTSHDVLTPMYSMRNLSTLSLQFNPIIEDMVVASLSTKCVNIRSLNVFRVWLSLLESLHISYLGRVTDESLEAAADHPRLKTLECRGCPLLTDLGFCALVTRCRQLSRLDVSGCQQVTDVTVEMAARQRQGSNFRLVLVVGGTGVKKTVKRHNCPSLQVLDTNLCLSFFQSGFFADFGHLW